MRIKLSTQPSTTEQRAVERVFEGKAVPPVGTWAIDPTHTSVEFVARHLMSKVRGRFEQFAGTITVGENPLESRVEVTVDASSVRTGTEQRDAHLLSPDFFDVENFKELRFTSTGVAAAGDEWLLDGELTIKDVTRPVQLHFAYLGFAVDPYGNDKVAFSAWTEVDREEFGLTWNAALETGGVLVGRTVRLEFELQAARA
jgi:polyisoprenoid-binding protein YceI